MDGARTHKSPTYDHVTYRIFVHAVGEGREDLQRKLLALGTTGDIVQEALFVACYQQNDHVRVVQAVDDVHIHLEKFRLGLAGEADGFLYGRLGMFGRRFGCRL